MSDLPRCRVIVSLLYQVIDVSHPDFLDVVSLNVFRADVCSHQRLLTESTISTVKCLQLQKSSQKKPEKNLIFLLFEQPVDVVILVPLSRPNNVFGTNDVEERLPLRVLC